MMSVYRTSFACLVLAFLLPAQTAPGSSDAIPVGPGIAPPRLVHKVQPKYSTEARRAHVQGTVVLQIVVDENGHPSDITVISPLGFGLDECAREAVERWKFVPGARNGAPVRTLTTVEVNFRVPRFWFDDKAEHDRTSFNVALRELKQGGKFKERAITTMWSLASREFPAAMYMVGRWEMTGENLAKDPGVGFALVQKAAARNYGPAMFDVAMHEIDGNPSPAALEKGLETMRQAAVLGSTQAQYFLGERYENGKGVASDPDRARRYYRLCATKGVARCQYRLADLICKTPDRPERDTIQAIAWFQLAADQGIPEARAKLVQETAKLTAAQMAWVNTLKPQLVHR